MRVTALAYVGVDSPNFKQWEDFGPTVLGMQVAEPGADGTQHLKVDDRHHRLSVHPGERDRLAYLGWEVATEDDFEQSLDDLARAEVETTPLTDEELLDRRADRVVQFVDQAGIRHELVLAQLLQHGSFHAPRRLSGFVTGEQGLGHAVIMVPDMDEAAKFYESVMGFALSDICSHPFPLRFLRCNRRHHSLAFASPPGTRTRGLHHLMLQLNDLDDVGRAYDLCRERNVPISMTLGRHTNDQMVSFYLRTPSGFDIEYGWGAPGVDDTTWVVASLDAASVWGHDMSGSLPPGCVEPCL